MSHERFTADEIRKAWDRSGGCCECCGEILSFQNRGRLSGRGSWEAHRGEGRVTPMVLCTGEPENCHLNCGHKGDYNSPGVTPRYHRVW